MIKIFEIMKMMYNNVMVKIFESKKTENNLIAKYYIFRDKIVYNLLVHLIDCIWCNCVQFNWGK